MREREDLYSTPNEICVFALRLTDYSSDKDTASRLFFQVQRYCLFRKLSLDFGTPSERRFLGRRPRLKNSAEGSRARLARC